ncbi:pyruvate kinase [Aeromicrobium panaciterrae]|uniref:Pyruvate kinase n=1 Tax=Aeromicrobium panaciterrae TaxID=363861 RepID=A0ABU1UPM1_9ACTN|nr:pyruvate kinase [Aeromicrobium panaciterrae]MDR7087109.1 pyruvate kinase [Aeromicrobium panaciterrae]
MRRAKIVCTLGPAVAGAEKILQLANAGMDVARLNMSHGVQADHEQNYQWVREAADKVGKAIAILADLQGPKIRLGLFAAGPVMLNAGSTFTITTDDILGDETRCSTTYKGLPGDVNVGDEILIDDGRMRLRATKVTKTDVTCAVETTGPVSNNKGINLPGVMVSVPAMSEKDNEDLRFALRLGVDFIALSFVRSASDYDDVRKIMDEEGIVVPVIAKIEKPQAVQNLDGIMDAFDGVMVARGDLGVELPLEDVPIVQKLIVEKARRNAKPVIVATQMLESMISAPRPTRAEASDVANAVLDGADAVMLSGETSVGEYPIHTVNTMARIVESTEDHGLPRMAAFVWKPRTKSGVICRAASEVAEAVDARFLVAFTTTGDSARRMTRYRSRVPVIAFTPDPKVRSQLALSWGIETFLVPEVKHTDDMVLQVDKALLEIGRCGEGQQVVIVAGSPPGIPGSTNALRIHNMGDAINRVAPAYGDPQG